MMEIIEILGKWYFKVRDERKKLSNEETDWILENFLQVFDEKSFSNAIFCLSLGSDYFERNPEKLDELLKWELDDYDLGQLFDAIKYAGLVGRYLDLLFKSCSFGKFENGFDYSAISALNAISDFIYRSKNVEVYDRLKEEYLIFRLGVAERQFCENEKSYLGFIYKALLFAKFGMESMSMSIDFDQTIDTELL